mmetsp:Transcript_84609/g.274104  ORF Transcript_84609/g.274104 Transcript_84609/m.274104 type:complete len:206 (-) Transcript_84609:129-746(-)
MQVAVKARRDRVVDEVLAAPVPEEGEELAVALQVVLLVVELRDVEGGRRLDDRQDAHPPEPVQAEGALLHEQQRCLGLRLLERVVVEDGRLVLPLDRRCVVVAGPEDPQELMVAHDAWVELDLDSLAMVLQVMVVRTRQSPARIADARPQHAGDSSKDTLRVPESGHGKCGSTQRLVRANALQRLAVLRPKLWWRQLHFRQGSII